MRKRRTAGTKKLVFECQLDLPRFETLERALLREIDPKLDCLILTAPLKPEALELLKT